MKVSRDWLQTFFEKPLPEAAVLADALTFHAFEIESVENDILDVKVTANRGHDCLCHRGIAKELAAILDVPMKGDPLRKEATLVPATDAVHVAIEDAALCPRFAVAYIKGVQVGPSPQWLHDFLESIGQRSINNVVDATNFVMFDLGQPLHAFDAGKLMQKDGTYALTERSAKEGERVTGLDDKEYELPPSALVILDAHAGAALSIAGIKGGKQTGIDHDTHELLLEGANWNGVNIRKTSQALKLRTDASQRFEQGLSPELAAYGVHACAELITRIAGGEVAGFVDEYPRKQQQASVSVSLEKVNSVLGTNLSSADIASVLRRLDLPHTEKNSVFEITAPFERLDLAPPAGGPEDIAEEVGRIIGYDKVEAHELPRLETKPEINMNFYTTEQKREELISQGYSEVFTSVFADTGERVVANKVDGVRPYLRTTLISGLTDALERNRRNKDLLAISEVKLFEIGQVWKDGKELTMVGTANSKSVNEALLEVPTSASDRYPDLPLSRTKSFQPFSKYPFIVRDISFWVPAETEQKEIASVIKESAGELLVCEPEKFDEFKKGDKVSYAFRLVFQSFDRTLTDTEANERMESVSRALREKGFEIR